MNSVFIDSPISDDVRRERLCHSQLFVCLRRPSIAAFAELARSLVEKAFAPHERIDQPPPGLHDPAL